MTLPVRQPIRVSMVKCASCIEKAARGSMSDDGNDGRNEMTWEMLKEGLSPVSSPR